MPKLPQINNFLKIVVLVLLVIQSHQEGTCSLKNDGKPSSCEDNNTKSVAKEELMPDPKPISTETTKFETENLEEVLDKYNKELLEKLGDVKYLNEFFIEDKEKAAKSPNKNFLINKAALNYLLNNKILFYDDRQMHGLYEGNFAQFFKITFEKNLPVVFTPDAMVYAFNHQIREILIITGEQFMFPLLVKLYFLMYSYIDQLEISNKELKFTIREVKKFMAVYIDLVGHEIKIEELEFPYDIPRIKYNNILKAIRSYSSEYSVDMMGIKQTFDFSKFMPKGVFAKSRYMSNVWLGIKWFSSFKFDKLDDIHFIWFLAKLVHESGSAEVYNAIIEALTYFFDGSVANPTLTEVYKIGTTLGLTSWTLSEKDKTLLISTIFSQTKIPYLPFTYLEYGKSSEAQIKEKEATYSFFPELIALTDWFNNSITDSNIRRYTSVSDFLFGVLGNNAEASLILDRINKKKNEIDNQRYFRFRDGTDIFKNLVDIRSALVKHYEKNPKNWGESLNNHILLMLRKLNKERDSSKQISLQEGLEDSKAGLTCLGGLTHYFAETEIHKYKVTEQCTDGSFPDFYVEDFLEVYKEMENILTNTRAKLTSIYEVYEKKIYADKPFIDMCYEKISDLNKAIDILKQAINAQRRKERDETVISNLQQMLTVDGQTYKGWYTKNLCSPLHKNVGSETEIMQHQVFQYRHFVRTKRVAIRDPGFAVYEQLKHNKVGLMLVHDETDNSHKIMLFTTYNPMEANFFLDKTPEFKTLIEFIDYRN